AFDPLAGQLVFDRELLVARSAGKRNHELAPGSPGKAIQVADGKVDYNLMEKRCLFAWVTQNRDRC
ncbi:MAG: hypothetical protein M3539_08015, partial [Acidobacteriota bacterium]|nr:hypothetical protein [Acidobacteriota bacterium]